MTDRVTGHEVIAVNRPTSNANTHTVSLYGIVKYQIPGSIRIGYIRLRNWIQYTRQIYR